MKVLIYSAKEFEVPFLEQANKGKFELQFTPLRLSSETAMLALGYPMITVFSADDCSPLVLEKLRDFGVKYISLRSAGYDNVNMAAANKYKIKVANAPDYSPNAIAEHAFALLLGLNRKLIRSQAQLKNFNFSLTELVGFDLNGKTAGVVGTGRIGSVIIEILHGFGCKILANDIEPNPSLEAEYDVQYCHLSSLCKRSDIIILSLPLTEESHYLFDKKLFNLMKDTAVLINVARGAIVKTLDVLDALDHGQIQAYGSDVYEKEADVFFYDHSDTKTITDAKLLRLIGHDRVLLTPHQAFATREAINNIAETTFYNFGCWANNKTPKNQL